MAPNHTSAYFPPLDKCLTGDDHIISWKTAYRALCDLDSAPENSALEAFLTDPETQHCLCHATSPAPACDPKTRAEFDTKTAPIHISQAAKGEYDLEQLKADALWLSEKTEVEELFALRVVIIEWQQRAQDQLMAATINNDDAGRGVRQNLRASMLAVSTANLGASTNGADTPAIDFSTEEVRHHRQLQMCVEEPSYMFKLSTELINRAALKDLPKTQCKWLQDLAEKVASDLCKMSDATANESFVSTILDLLDYTWNKLVDPSTRGQVFKDDDTKAVMFEATTLTDITTALRSLLANEFILDSFSGHGHVVVGRWFKFMEKTNFFQGLVASPALPSVEPLQSLASVVSVSMLNLPGTIAQLQDKYRSLLDEVQYPQLNATTWYQNEACFKDVNLILYNAAMQKNFVASPVIYAWSIIGTFIQDVSKQIRELREQQHEESSDGEPVSRRRASRRDSTEAQSIFEKLNTCLQDFDIDPEVRDNVATWYAEVSVDPTFSLIPQLSETISSTFGSEIEEGTPFFSRTVLLSLIRQGFALVAYGSELVEAVLSLLSPSTHGRSTKLDNVFVNAFFHSDDFGPALLEEALGRYPYELTPCVRLLTALAQLSSSREAGETNLIEILENMQSLTVMVTEDFRDYALEHEDENNNSMALIEPVPLFASKQALAYGTDGLGRRAITHGAEGEVSSKVLAIPAGAPGFVVKESRPLVFRLEHHHSAQEYLGLLLSSIRPNSQYVTAPFENVLDVGAAAEIVTLLTALMKASLKQHQGPLEARWVLGRFGCALPDEQDIIVVIADIFEIELLSHLDQSFQPDSLQLLIACAAFFDTLTAISPERVWSTLARSSLLGLASGANALAAVVGGTEVQTGRFRFLGACASLFSHLIDDAISGLIQRKDKVNKATNRFDSPTSYHDATPERTMTTVINAYQAVMVDTWRSLGEWRFLLRSEKVEITEIILSAFDTLLLSAYGVENKVAKENKISALLKPAAKALLDAFNGKPENGSALQAFGTVFTTGCVLADDSSPVDELLGTTKQLNAANRLLTTALRVSRKDDKDLKRVASLSTQLLNYMPSLALLQAAGVKRSTSTLLAELVQTLKDSTNADPPSLLSQLSTDVGKNFLAVITELDRPINDLETECAIWDFLSAVMTSKQQWFAIYLLTGALPKERLKDHKTGKAKSLLTYALNQLFNIRDISPDRAMAILKFIASAQSAWVWATNEVRLHAEFLPNSLSWLHSLAPPSRANVAQEILGAQEHQIAAYLCDILAVNLHASREIGDTTVLKMLIPRHESPHIHSRLGFLSLHGGAVDAYNRSLHTNLAENFARKFNGCQIADFVRTNANPAPFGSDYFYDRGLADRVLGHEPAWEGISSNGRQHGFADEFSRANVNLSLVNAQRSLLKSWRVLATMLCEYIVGQSNLPTQLSTKLQEDLAQTAVKSLNANSTANLDVPGMDGVVNIRADMAFVIVSKLVAAKAEFPAMEDLLPASWNLLRSSPVDYDVATAAEDLRYYRTMLQILYLAIQPYVYMKPERPGHSGSATRPSASRASATNETIIDYLDPEIAAIFVEIVAKTVAPGFRALCGNLHNSMDLATPADFALLTAVLRAILSVRGIDSVHLQIAHIIASTSLIRGALSLYSWADQLAEVMEQDPVYGEVAAMFLVVLSGLRPVAEFMAVEGVLLQLSSANLSNYYRKFGGKGPFDEPRRMFSIWTEAFLPLCLNLLDAVGPAIAGDAAAFLNEFPEQLRRAESALENVAPSMRNPHAGAVTLGLLSEAHSLCLIGLILHSDTLRGAAEGINPADVPTLEYDYRKVKEEAVGLMRQKTSLQSRIVAVGQREEIWKATDGVAGYENVLQAKVVNEIKALMDAFGES